MDSLIIFILIATLIVPFLIAYYYDYKSDPKGFSYSVKSVAKGFLRYVVILIVGLVLNSLYEALIPFDKDHGISFNSERQKNGLPLLNESWYFDEDRDEQFTSIWWKRNTDHGHFKKIIDYNIFGLTSETNYYKNPNYPEKFNGTIYAWTIYDFSSKTMTYHMDNPEYDRFLSSRKEEQEKTIEISQKVFEEYLNL